MFRTEIPLTPDARQLARTARVLTLGSCFADSIGSRLTTYKVAALVNPFGTVFNPLSASLLLRAAAGEPVDWTQHLVEARGRWQSYDLHGSIGAESGEALLVRIQELVRQTTEFVRAADVLALTLGTAWVYRLHETGELVSNCHKMPASLFEKELLTTEDIVGSMAEAHALLRRLNPHLRLVLTVSPVRHLRDTLPLNSVSKSVLRLASHYLSELLPDVSYFPAYELLTDDLRDYRFYAADMLHPSAVAEDYVWERFARTYFDAEFGRFRKEWDGIQQALAHRPLHAGVPEHRQFLESTLEKLRRLTEQQVEVRAEIRDVERRLLSLPPPPRLKPAAVPEPEDDGEERVDIELSAPAEPASAAEPSVLPAERDENTARPDASAEMSPDGRARGGRGRPDRRSQGRNKPEARPIAAEAQLPPEQGQAAVTTVAGPLPPKPSYTDYLISSAPQLVTLTPKREAVTPTDAAPEIAASGNESAAELPKKKKRRSRGGAKRTARKNAARLAAEQTDDTLVTQFSSALEAAPDGSIPESELNAEASMAPASTTDDAPTQPNPGLTAVEESSADESSNASGVAPNPAKAPVASNRKRGAGPAAKKSKVITKSVPVKRPPRRGAAPAPASLPAAPAAPPAIITTAVEGTEARDVPAEPRPVIDAVDTTPAAVPTPLPTAKPVRPATARRPPATKEAKPNVPAASAKPKPKPAKKAAPTASRTKAKKAPVAPDAAPGAGETLPANRPTPPVAAGRPATPGGSAEAAPARRGRPPGPKKRPPAEPSTT